MINTDATIFTTSGVVQQAPVAPEAILHIEGGNIFMEGNWRLFVKFVKKQRSVGI